MLLVLILLHQTDWWRLLQCNIIMINEEQESEMSCYLKCSHLMSRLCLQILHILKRVHWLHWYICYIDVLLLVLDTRLAIWWRQGDFPQWLLKVLQPRNLLSQELALAAGTCWWYSSAALRLSTRELGSTLSSQSQSVCQSTTYQVYFQNMVLIFTSMAMNVWFAEAWCLPDDITLLS